MQEAKDINDKEEDQPSKREFSSNSRLKLKRKDANSPPREIETPLSAREKKPKYFHSKKSSLVSDSSDKKSAMAIGFQNAKDRSHIANKFEKAFEKAFQETATKNSENIEYLNFIHLLQKLECRGKGSNSNLDEKQQELWEYLNGFKNKFVAKKEIKHALQSILLIPGKHKIVFIQPINVDTRKHCPSQKVYFILFEQPFVAKKPSKRLSNK